MKRKPDSILIEVSELLHENIRVMSFNTDKTLGNVTKIILRRIEEKHKDLITKNNEQ